MKRVNIFDEFDEKQLELLKPLFEPFSCQANEIIFRQGAPAEFFYLVTSGLVDMSFKPHDGSAITISHIENGGLFGWSALLGREIYTSSAIAIQDVEAFRVSGSKLRKFCVGYPEAGKELLERLIDRVSSRWRDAHKQIRSTLVQGLTEKSKSI